MNKYDTANDALAAAKDLLISVTQDVYIEHDLLYIDIGGKLVAFDLNPVVYPL